MWSSSSVISAASAGAVTLREVAEPRSPIMQAETCALRSPMISRGMRTLARMNLKMSRPAAPLVQTDPRDPEPFLEHVGAVAGDRPGNRPPMSP